jgi:glycosyltransferase involved in cell wall biosynthesis
MWGKDAPQLNIVGDGPLKPELQKMSEGLPIKFHGYLPTQDAHNMIMNAILVILPSECYEGFPMVIAQSFSAATPVMVSNLGPLPRIVEDGITGCVFEASNANSLLNALQKLYRNSALLTDMSVAARNKYLVKYTEEANYNEIMNIYEQALINRSKKLN